MQFKIYDKRAIQILINEHWIRAKISINIFLFMPYLVMLTLYSIWSNAILHENQPWATGINSQINWALWGLSLYFLIFEGVLFVVDPAGYLGVSRKNIIPSNVWSIFKVAPMILVLINTTGTQDEA